MSNGCYHLTFRHGIVNNSHLPFKGFIVNKSWRLLQMSWIIQKQIVQCQVIDMHLSGWPSPLPHNQGPVCPRRAPYLRRCCRGSESELLLTCATPACNQQLTRASKCTDSCLWFYVEMEFSISSTKVANIGHRGNQALLSIDIWLN